MARSSLSRLAIALALAVAPFARPATAGVSDTLTIVGTFTPIAPDDTPMGVTHTWTLTMYGVTSEQFVSSSGHPGTSVRATSFDLAFSGPDAATLDAVVGTHGGAVTLDMVFRSSWSTWSMSLEGVGLFFDNSYGSLPTWLTCDADGYPIPSPQTLGAEVTMLYDEGGNYYAYSWSDTLNVSGEVAPPPPPPAPTLGITDGSVVEGNPGKNKVTLRLTVALSSLSAQTVTVNYRTVAGTALASDFTSAAGTLTFLSGEKSKTITISVKTDRVREANETFSVELFNPAGATLGDAVATATIVNDD